MARRATSSETTERSVPALSAPTIEKDNPFTRSLAGLIGIAFLLLVGAVCLGSLPWTLSPATDTTDVSTPRFNAGSPRSGRLPPIWWSHTDDDRRRLLLTIDPDRARALAEPLASEWGLTTEDALSLGPSDPRFERLFDTLRPEATGYLLGTDVLGRSLWVRILTGGGISLGIGLAAALISVAIGTLYGAIAGYLGGRTDAVLMRIVDILYGLPYILLVVLLAVAVEAFLDDWVAGAAPQKAAERAAFVEARIAALPEAERSNEDALAAIEAEALDEIGSGELSQVQQNAINVVTLLIAIGGVSWLTMARVVRGQVMSLKAQPFVEAARAVGAPTRRIFIRHLLPNLLGPIIVYATLTVPQAILQESFLSFLGIGVKPPLPSWGNLAAEGLTELNPYKSNWWLLFFPCLMLGVTLLALNFVGEGLREAFDPKRARR
ncbi:MAG: ABC transporter permease [Planctomycetota bacterium]